MHLFPGRRSKDKEELSDFEFAARKKLLEANRLLDFDEDLGELCDKVDDLLDATASVTRLLLEYVDKKLSAAEKQDDGDGEKTMTDEEVEEAEQEEYERFRGDVSFEAFRLLKYALYTHIQRTESMSQVVDVLYAEEDRSKWPGIICTMLDIATNQIEYTKSRHLDDSILNPPLSMSFEEFQEAQKRYHPFRMEVERIMKDDDLSEYQKSEKLVEEVLPHPLSREVATMILVFAWTCKSSSIFPGSLFPRPPGSLLQRLAHVDRLIKEEQEHSSPFGAGMPAMEPRLPLYMEEFNKNMEERLQRLGLNPDQEGEEEEWSGRK